MLDGLRKWNLITGFERNALQRRRPAGRHIDPVAAALFEFVRERNGVFERPATLDPIGRRIAYSNRLVGRNRATQDIDDCERKARAVFDRPAVFVVALISDRRQEL